MQNSMFLAVLRLIFALKTKTAPPKRSWVRVGEDRGIMMTNRSGCKYTWRPFFWRSPDFGQKNILNYGEDLFFIFILWKSLDFGQKNTPNFGEDLFFSFFFWRSPGFHWTLLQSNSRLMKIRVKFVCGWMKLQKKPPPFAKSWLRDW